MNWSVANTTVKRIIVAPIIMKTGSSDKLYGMSSNLPKLTNPGLDKASAVQEKQDALVTKRKVKS